MLGELGTVSEGLGAVGEGVSGADGIGDRGDGSGVPVWVTVGAGTGRWSLFAAALITTRRISPPTMATTTAANTMPTTSRPLFFRGGGAGVGACQAWPSQYRVFGAPEGSEYQPEPVGPVIT